jgi:glycerate-2-kinase
MFPDEFKMRGIRLFGIGPRDMSPVEIAKKKAIDMGFDVHIMNKRLMCDAFSAGRMTGHMAILCTVESQPFKTPCILLHSGELLVTVGKSKGVGGRNQEFALAMAQAIKGNNRIVVAAVDTDGTDGPGGYICEDAQAKGVICLSGAIIDGYTIGIAEKKGLDVVAALVSHDTSNILWELGDGIVATQNISMTDLHVIVILGENNNAEFVIPVNN